MSLPGINPDTGSILTKDDIFLFHEGTHYNINKKLGSTLCLNNNKTGVFFAVWAPNAKNVFLMGDFNSWDKKNLPLQKSEGEIWIIFVESASANQRYKFNIESKIDGQFLEKSDPFGDFFCQSPDNSSIIYESKFQWNDEGWLKTRADKNRSTSPISIYEVHPGSWMKNHDNSFLGYRDLADKLTDYVVRMGFTHVQFTPIAEHPFYGSWGYQSTGYFAPTSRYGTPDDFKYLINKLHKSNIGVILEWIPTYFPGDEHGLSHFDGTNLFEYKNFSKSSCTNCESYFFDYSKKEVKSFLLSNAIMWLQDFHIDGLKINLFANCCQNWDLDNSTLENEVLLFTKKLNQTILELYPSTLLLVNTDYTWKNITKPLNEDGIGFSYKFDKKWINSLLEYCATPYEQRKFSHNLIVFKQDYSFDESYILPLSHDEITYGKGSLFSQMPGDPWKKQANIRLLFLYIYTHPCKKLIFMGNEFAQIEDWNHDRSLDWNLLTNIGHNGIHRLFMNLNHLYKNEKILHEHDVKTNGFNWIDCNDWKNNTILYMRKSSDNEQLVIALNFNSKPFYDYRIGLPESGSWIELLNTDDMEFGGSGVANTQEILTENIEYHNQKYSVNITLPPLGGIILKKE